MKPWYLRLFLWLLCTLVYRVKVVGRDRVPLTGGALIVSNHVSFVDTLLLLASTPRFIRFMLLTEICAVRWLQPALRLLRVIRLPDPRQARELAEALRQAAGAIRSGEVVGVFAEKRITRIGVMLPFSREFESIMAGLDAPIIPACLDGVWGSVFSYEAGRFFWKVPRHWPYPLSVSFGAPMPADSTAVQVRTAIQDLATEAWPYRKRGLQPLGRAFVRQARRHPFRFAMADTRVPNLTFGGVLTKTVFLARRLRSPCAGQKNVGIFLPPSVGGALANLSVLLAGKVPVNLNYTLSTEALVSCARQCHLETILSSRVFLERMKMTLPCHALLLEEVAVKPKSREKILALLLAWLCPTRWLEKAIGCEARPRLDDLATLVFSSGSTGDPKGIMLSHYNLVSNVAQLGETFDFSTRDRCLGILPFFHSFGLMATLLTPAIRGIGVVFHPNPLEAKAIGELARAYRVTYLMATPAFLQIYLRTCEAEDFGSLQLVMAGAEKLPEWLASAFEEKFGIRPVEGYGCTECSPAIAVNSRDFREAGLRQLGIRRGKIGHPLPGVSIRIVDPVTRAPLKPGDPGLLLVRGPNVMQGYLGRPEKTAEVLRDGWYETGDIASLDEEGFLQITDRLSRFSKIAGEMVPHVRVEEVLQELAGVQEQAFVVAGVPDEKKGERLVVLHTLGEAALTGVLKRLAQSKLPNLWMPKAGQFFRVDELPQLASGKLDLRRIREEANRLSREHPISPPVGDGERVLSSPESAHPGWHSLG